MSLTAEDLHAIRAIVQDETRTVVQVETRPIVQDELSREVAPISVKLSNLSGKIEALENDIREIYDMISRIEKATGADKDFLKLTVEKKILRVNSNLLTTAKEAGVNLPRS